MEDPETHFLIRNMSDFSEAMGAHRQIIGSHSMQWCHAIGVQGFYLARCKVNPGEAQNAGQNPPHLGSTPGADLYREGWN